MFSKVRLSVTFIWTNLILILVLCCRPYICRWWVRSRSWTSWPECSSSACVRRVQRVKRLLRRSGDILGTSSGWLETVQPETDHSDPTWTHWSVVRCHRHSDGNVRDYRYSCCSSRTRLALQNGPCNFLIDLKLQKLLAGINLEIQNIFNLILHFRQRSNTILCFHEPTYY